METGVKEPDTVPEPSESSSLYDARPDLAREWHPTKNGSLSPKDVTPGSGRLVWWLCEKGHWWLATVRARTRGMKCTFCRDLMKQGEQRMVDSKPELLKEWHPTRNADLNARDVPSNYKGGVWWICELGHEWKAAIPCRLVGKSCPLCKKMMPGSSTDRSVGLGPTTRPVSDRRPWKDNSRLTDLREEDTTRHYGLELRRSKRYQGSAVVMIEDPRLGIMGYAQLHNFSAGGMMFDSDFRIHPGRTINVRFDKPMYFSPSNVISSKVIWCRDLESQEEAASLFGIGVRLS